MWVKIHIVEITGKPNLSIDRMEETQSGCKKCRSMESGCQHTDCLFCGDNYPSCY